MNDRRQRGAQARERVDADLRRARPAGPSAGRIVRSRRSRRRFAERRVERDEHGDNQRAQEDDPRERQMHDAAERDGDVGERIVKRVLDPDRFGADQQPQTPAEEQPAERDQERRQREKVDERPLQRRRTAGPPAA